MKPFNLEEAKAGKPVCTRNGRKARIVCFDGAGIYSMDALIKVTPTDEINFLYDVYGRIDYTGTVESEYDLMMVEDEKPKCPFKPFDKVLVRDDYDDCSWCCALFSHIEEVDGEIYYYCHGFSYDQCIPCNEETEHLIGTTDAPPEKYVIW